MSEKIQYIIDIDDATAQAKITAIADSIVSQVNSRLSSIQIGGSTSGFTGGGSTTASGAQQQAAGRAAASAPTNVPPPVPTAQATPGAASQSGGGSLPLPPVNQTWMQQFAQAAAGNAGGGMLGQLAGGNLAGAAGPAAIAYAAKLQIQNSIESIQKLVGAITELTGTIVKTSLNFAANPNGAAGFTIAGAAITGLGKGAEAHLQGAGGFIAGPLLKELAAPIVVIGQATTALGGMAEAAKQAAESLSEYNGTLFAAMIDWQMFTVGLKYQMAAELAGPLSGVMVNLERLAVTMEPLVVHIVEVFAGFIDAITPSLERTIQVVTALEASLEVMLLEIIDFVHTQAAVSLGIATGGISAMLGFTGPSGKGDALKEQAQNNLVKALSALMQPLDSIDRQLQDTKNAGAAIVTGLYRAASAWAKDKHVGDIHGMQVGGWKHEKMGFQGVPNATNAVPDWGGPAGQGAAMGFLNGAANAQQAGRHVPVIPQPTPAAVHLHTSDVVNVQASDYQTIHDEMLMFTDRVWNYLSGMQAGNWRRLVNARYSQRSVH